MWDESTKKILTEVVNTDEGLLMLSIIKLTEVFLVDVDVTIVVKLLEEVGLTMLIDSVFVVEFTIVTWHFVCQIDVNPYK